MMENAMINRELDIAKQIQQSFLPECRRHFRVCS